MSSRRAQKEAARKARLANERADAERRARRKQRLSLAGGFGVIVVIAGALLLLARGQPPTPSTPPAKAGAGLPPYRTHDLAAAARLAGARRISHDYSYGIGDHTSGNVTYPTNPPTNGPHFFTPALDGSYAGKSSPRTEQVVHSLEHGRVVIQYRPGLRASTLRELEALYAESPQHVLLVENKTSMPCDVAATAWAHGVLCPHFTQASIDALRAFRDRYRDKGPERIA
jgi:hypothetical protein